VFRIHIRKLQKIGKIVATSPLHKIQFLLFTLIYLDSKLVNIFIIMCLDNYCLYLIFVFIIMSCNIIIMVNNKNEQFITGTFYYLFIYN